MKTINKENIGKVKNYFISKKIKFLSILFVLLGVVAVSSIFVISHVVNAAGSLPDLAGGIVSSVYTPRVPADSFKKSFTFSAIISNVGNASTGASFLSFFRIASDANGNNIINVSTSLPEIATLNAGTNYTRSQYMYFPLADATFAETHYVQVCADVAADGSLNGPIVESDETNNCGPWTKIATTVPPSPTTFPDLIAGNGSGKGDVLPNTAVANQLVQFSEIISNTGNAATTCPSAKSGSCFTNFFQVAVDYKDPATIINLQETTMGGLAVGASNTAVSPKYSLASAGTYYVRACADLPPYNNGVITESNEGNNCSPWTTVTVSSDTVVSGAITPASSTCTIAVENNTCTQTLDWSTSRNAIATSAITSNIGTPSSVDGNSGSQLFTIPYNNGVNTEFYLYNEANLLATATVTPSCASGTAWDTVSRKCKAMIVDGFPNLFHVKDPNGVITDVDSVSMSALAAGASATATSSFYTFSSLGTYYVQACADQPPVLNGTIAESDETNNCGEWRSIVITNNPMPDLTASVPVPETILAPGKITFSSRITNSGTASTGSGFKNLFQKSTFSDGRNPDNYVVDSVKSSLSSGGSVSINAQVTFAASGTYYIRVCADNDDSFVGAITEANEGNNCSNSSVSWAPVVISNNPAPAVTISASPKDNINPLSSSTLTWIVAGNADSCTATGGTTGDGWSGPKEFTNGTHNKTINEIANTTAYRITCENANGISPEAEVIVTVKDSQGTAGVCSSPAKHFECSLGDPVSKNESSATAWTWYCSHDSKLSPQCSQSKKSPSVIEN